MISMKGSFPSKKKKKKNIDSSFLFLITFFLLSSFTSSFFFSLLFFFLLLCSTHPNTEREERVRLRGREGEIREMRFERERERGRDWEIGREGAGDGTGLPVAKGGPILHGSTPVKQGEPISGEPVTRNPPDPERENPGGSWNREDPILH
jgi:hypothetical protein